MEEELIEKALSYISRAEYYLKERRFDMAYNSYMDALYTIGAYLVYRDTGLLLPARELMGMLESRHPEVYDVIKRYSEITLFDEDTVSALRDDLERLRGMMSLPSSEE
ncbi:hypothetical protein [Thermococcus piezophilus]|uniref:HEPN domain-containing protein n=1 Tax=Thermococcus piezophilus TaxID=1712654 RepID=A0A172WH37_9EURY|nr:hypothetical protein [Thermococcus piezophilus]ANF22772.1 hypothetical protein A7C91_06000 [Thermococcus piezophilus]